MTKKLLALLLSTLLLVSIFSGCAKKAGNAGKSDLKVGMVTDSGTIDDKSFNQGTWEGLQKACEELGLESRYLKPSGTTEAEYTAEISNLYDAGFRLIITPGFKFADSIAKVQTQYPDCKFVIIDSEPAGNVTAENTVSIYFAEQQGGFLAGVAASLQLQSGDLGVLGGMQIPPVQRYNWGFQQGIKYANENYGTTCTLKAENDIYTGSFADIPQGQQVSAQMYDRGVKAVYGIAGATGVGGINEAKTRRLAGDDVWYIGCDVDQYDDGIYTDGKSAILTSSLKKIDVAAYDMVKAAVDGTFPGGQVLNLDLSNDGVGFPATNPNLSDDVSTKISDVIAKIKSGDITISAEQGDLLP